LPYDLYCVGATLNPTKKIKRKLYKHESAKHCGEITFPTVEK
jgi:hypothetical protein